MTRSDMMGMTPVGNPEGSGEERQRARSAPTVNALRQEIQSSDRATQCSALSIHSTVVMGSVTECFLIAWVEVQDRVHAGLWAVLLYYCMYKVLLAVLLTVHRAPITRGVRQA